MQMLKKNVKIRFITSSYELESLLPRGKNKNVVGLMTDELGGKIMTECFTCRNCCGKQILRGKCRNFCNFFFRNNIISVVFM